MIRASGEFVEIGGGDVWGRMLRLEVRSACFIYSKLRFFKASRIRKKWASINLNRFSAREKKFWKSPCWREN